MCSVQRAGVLGMYCGSRAPPDGEPEGDGEEESTPSRPLWCATLFKPFPPSQAEDIGQRLRVGDMLMPSDDYLGILLPLLLLLLTVRIAAAINLNLNSAWLYMCRSTVVNIVVTRHA